MFLLYLNFLGILKFLKNFNSLLFINFNKNLKNFYFYFLTYKSNSRIFSNNQKNRSLINFSTKKIYPQKGTGKARAGSLSSPTRIKGGISFPNYSYQNYLKKINKKIYKYSIFKIIYYYFLKKKYFLIDDLYLLNINSNVLLKKINKFFIFNKKNKNIFIFYKINKKFFFSLNNIYYLNLIHIFNINPIMIIKYEKLFLTFSFYNYLNNIYV